MVARWFVFKPKIPIWVSFGGSCYAKYWYILWPFGLVYGHWKYFMAIWYILWKLGIFSPVFGILDQEKSGNPVSSHLRGTCGGLHIEVQVMTKLWPIVFTIQLDYDLGRGHNSRFCLIYNLFIAFTFYSNNLCIGQLQINIFKNNFLKLKLFMYNIVTFKYKIDTNLVEC
jgi:hypothetical protein